MEKQIEEWNMKWKQALHRAYVGIILGDGKENGDKYIARDYVADSAGCRDPFHYPLLKDSRQPRSRSLRIHAGSVM